MDSLAIMLLCIALAVIIGFITFIVQRKVYTKITRREREFVRTKGVVVALRRSKNGESNGQVYPEVKYYDNYSNEYILKSNYSRGSMDYKKKADNDELTEMVLYNPENPSEAYIDMPVMKYLPLIIGSGFTILILVIGISGYFYNINFQ